MRNDERRKSLQSLEFPFILVIPTCFKKKQIGDIVLPHAVRQSVCLLSPPKPLGKFQPNLIYDTHINGACSSKYIRP